MQVLEEEMPTAKELGLLTISEEEKSVNDE